jgi:hypothetical protein
MFKLFAAVTLAASLAASAQMDMKPSGHQSTDKEKIADALRAGPLFIVKDATIADRPADPKAPNAEYRVLRAGKSDWTCLPGIPGYPHDEPMCFDKTSMRWIKDSLADHPMHIDQIGVMYMFSGAWVPDLHGTSHSADHTYHAEDSLAFSANCFSFEHQSFISNISDSMTEAGWAHSCAKTPLSILSRSGCKSGIFDPL